MGTNVQVAQTQPPAPSTFAGFAYRGLTRNAPVRPCVISVADLRRLYAELVPMAREAMNRHLENLQRPADQTEQAFSELKEHARSLGIVTVAIDGLDGE